MFARPISPETFERTLKRTNCGSRRSEVRTSNSRLPTHRLTDSLHVGFQLGPIADGDPMLAIDHDIAAAREADEDLIDANARGPDQRGKVGLGDT